ncbi:MAG: MBL fold metallo-hydrolase [Clostridium sp.]|nr:MBL fold metallo-hydrolase [Clostridium sp.]
MRESKDKFIVKFRGVRGSHPTPDFNFLEYGGNTACIEVNVNGHLIILDAGTGIIKCGTELMKDYAAQFHKEPISATILLSHVHNDHIQGLPFFKPLHINSSKINIVGFSEYEEGLDSVISQLMFDRSFPLSLNDLNAKLSFYDINDNYALILTEDSDMPEMIKIESGEDITPEGDEVIISCLKSNSHPKQGVMIYKIAYKDKSLVYATDTEGFIGANKKLVLFARDTDLLIHDAQYTTEEYLNSYFSKQGYGHSTFDMALETFSQAKAKSLAFYHYDPNYTDEFLLNIEKHYTDNCKDCFLPKEGQEIVIL